VKAGNRDGNGVCVGRLRLLGVLVPSSPWEHLCFSPLSHPPPPPEERSEEEEVQPGWMGVAGVVGSLHRAGMPYLPAGLGLSILCRWDFHPP